MLHPSIERRPSTVGGHGLFATAPIRQGEVIWDDDGEAYHRVSIAEVRRWPEERRAKFLRICYQLDEETLDGPEEGQKVELSMYMNHSCDPNTWFEPDDPTKMTARRAITVDEEVTFDYATSDTHEWLRLECRCGAKLCRGIVTGADYFTRPEMRAMYGRHVSPHVLRMLGARTKK